MTKPVPSCHPDLKRRLVAELEIIRRQFGDAFSLDFHAVDIKGNRGNPLAERFAVGGVVPVERQRIHVRVVYPRLYPLEPPAVWVADVVPSGCPHLLALAGRWAEICWIDGAAGGGSQRRWDPNRHTAATALLAAQRWIAALMVWQRLGRWPVVDAWEADR